MELERVKLDWDLNTSEKWKVDRIIGGLVTGIAEKDTVEFDSGVIIVNNEPWGLGMHNASTDIFRGFVIPKPIVRPSVRVQIERTTCLICELDPLPPPNPQTTKFWIATQQGGVDSYEHNWKLEKGWFVRFLAPTTLSGVIKNKEVKLTPVPTTKVMINGGEWGTITSYEEKWDKITGTPKADGTTFTIRRRAAIICTFPPSGGSSWIAVEGGRP